MTITDLILYDNFYAQDLRGSFQKLFQKQKLDIELREIFFSVSAENVIRGMHFQTPPCPAAKLISVISGEVLDVVLDLRKNSPTFLKYQTLRLSASKPQSLFIPAGVAHGFLSLKNDSVMVYCTTHEHVPECDCGIRYDSFGFEWPVPPQNRIISLRDQNLIELKDFETPFP